MYIKLWNQFLCCAEFGQTKSARYPVAVCLKRIELTGPWVLMWQSEPQKSLKLQQLSALLRGT